MEGKNPTGKIRAALDAFLFMLLIMCLLAVMAGRADAAESYNFYQRKIYDIDSGLQCGTANAAASTSDGILWVGTNAGLYRFNGRDMILMDQIDSVKDVNTLYCDKDDNLWVGTRDSGITVLHDGEKVAALDHEGGLPSDTIKCLGGDGRGHLLAGMSGGTLSLELNNDQDGKARIDVRGTIVNMEQPEELALYANGNSAVVDADGFLTLARSGEAVDTAVPDDDYGYTALIFDKEGTLFAGRDDGKISVFDTSEGTLEEKGVLDTGRDIRINSLYSYKGTLFACTVDGVSYQNGGGDFTWISMADFNGSVESMTTDFQGNLWFTSIRLGLLELYHSPVSELFQSAGLQKTVVNTETGWQDLLYIGTDDGLYAIDPESGESREDSLTRSFSHIRIRCLMVDSEDDLWIGTFGEGLIKVAGDGKRKCYRAEDGLFSNDVREVTQLPDGRIAACGNDGFCTIKKNGEIDDSLIWLTGSTPVTCLLQGEDGSLLAGTEGDGISLIRDGEVQEIFNRTSGLSSDIILRMVKSPQTGSIYAVTSNGICMLEKEGNRFKVRRLEHFPYPNNYDIWFREGGTMFIPGSAGVYVIDEEELLADKKDPDYQLLNSEWGFSSSLTSDAWNYEDEEGNLYLASCKGVFVLNTGDYAYPETGYHVQIRDAVLDEDVKAIRPDRTFRIGHRFQRLVLQPEVVNYSMSDPMVTFQLEGYDQKATTVPYSMLKNITYTGLPAGRYTFRLSVTDSENHEKAEQTYYLVKEEAFYKSPWFRLLRLAAAGALLMLMVWILNEFRHRKEQKKKDEQLRESKEQVEMANEAIMLVAKTLDARDRYTSQHSERVSQYSCLIGREMGLPEDECENLRKVALLHDIGKVGVPDAILNKPGRLTDEEYAAMKKHVDYGAEILKNFTGLRHAAEGAQFHHERYDGRGYTHGLKGDQIPLYGRIIGVADAFDAMTSNRCYRKHLDMKTVLGELERCKGSQFDPKIADIMIGLVKRGEVKPD